MVETREVIVRLLESLGSAREVAHYLKQFSGLDARRFAVVKVGGGIVRDELDELASALTFLVRVGLFPIVVHGAGPQLDDALARQSIVTERVDGMRVTTAEVLAVARQVFEEVSLSLVDRLEQLGTRARPISSDVFEATLIDRDRLGLVGRVESCRIAGIEAAIDAGHIPVIRCLGESRDGQIVNVNADVAARALGVALNPYKVIFLTPTGGLLDERGEIMSAINLATDFDALMDEPWLHSGMRLKLIEVKALLESLPRTSSVSITSPQHLARELFTHQGSGTLVRIGEAVTRHGSLDGIDTAVARRLIESCFERTLDGDYFESRSFYRAYATDSMTALALLTRPVAVPYLDKFAVTKEAQGLGIGASVWKAMRADEGAVFWRSRVNNPINGWYFRQATGTYRSGEWVVFWAGVDTLEAARDCIDYALSHPPSLGSPER